MRIGRTNGIGSGFGADRRAVDRRVEPIADAAGPGADASRRPVESRALVPVLAARPREAADGRATRLHAHAPFIAQLIATRDDMPETRRLRRAEPARAARAYADTADGPGLLVPGYFLDVAG